MSSSNFIAAVEYREVVGFRGYRVGDDGSIWSRHRGGIDWLKDEWKQLKPWPGNAHGHLAVGLRMGGGRYKRYVHQLVLDAFIGACPPGQQCRHLDDDRLNNRLSNLCWGTQAENYDDRRRNGRDSAGSRHHHAILVESQVAEIRSLAAAGVARRELAGRFGIHRGQIDRIVTGKAWKHVAG
jgi:hypothetical protein